MKDSGRRTARGAVIWRAASGPVPDGHLSPKQANERLAALLKAEHRRPHATKPQVVGKTFGAACDAYLEYLEFDKGIAATTLRRYKGIVRKHLKPVFGETTPLTRVSSDSVDRYRSSMLEGGELSSSSMRQHMIVLGGTLKRARRRGWIAMDPMIDIEKIHVPTSSGDFNVLEPAQVQAVARAAVDGRAVVVPGSRHRTQVTLAHATRLNEQGLVDAAVHEAVILFAAFTGLRIGELRALRWRDISTRDAVIHVRNNFPTSAPAGSEEKAPKSNKVRSVPLSAPALRALQQLRLVSRFTAPSDYVFPSPTGLMIDGGAVRDAFYAGLQHGGLGHLREKPNPIVFHDLRHTFGTLAVRVFPLTDVQAYMGHADISTTMRYVHHVPRRDAAQRLSAAFEVTSGEDDGWGEEALAA